MRAFDPVLQAHLDSGATTLCHCWRIVRRDGETIGFTDHDRPLAFDGVTFAPETGASGAALTSSADLSVDNGEIEGALTSERLSPEDLIAGRYDGASVEVWRVNWAAPDQRWLQKSGVIGEVKRDGDRFTAEIRGLSHALDQASGRVYQRQCDARLGDARCGVDLDTPQLTASGTVSALVDDQRFTADGLGAFDDGWFDHGVLVWTGGANAGTRGLVKAHGVSATGTSLSLWTPAGAAVAAGDTFTISAGCDRRHQTCAEIFGNLVNFRGFHLMPGNDFAVSYPLRGERNDGGRR